MNEMTCPTCNRTVSDGRYCPFDGTALAAAGRVGGLIGGSRLLGEVGRGATGTVYRGWHEQLDRPVAVKVLHRHLIASPEQRERFRREALATARLTHPNIVTVYGSGESPGGVPYISMELVRGDALDVVFPRGTKVPVASALSLLRQVAQALHCAHAAGIVHRDLKLGNIMLIQGPGMDDQVKVVDFGIAKIAGGQGAHSELTREGAMCGTPEYVSPEQALGRSIDHRTDFYSLGVILYRLLSGRLPFEKRGVAAVVAHVREAPTPIDALVAGLPSEVVALLERCMAKEPELRFPDARAIIVAIDEALAADRELGPQGVDSAVVDDSDVACSQSWEVVQPRFRHEPDRGSGWLAVLTLVACVLAGGLAVWRVGVAVAVPVGVDASSVATVMAPADSAGEHTFLASSQSLSLRATVPASAAVGVPTTVVLEAWNADGSAALITATADLGGAAVEFAEVGPGRSQAVIVPVKAGRWLLTLRAEGDIELGVALDIGLGEFPDELASSH